MPSAMPLPKQKTKLLRTFNLVMALLLAPAAQAASPIYNFGYDTSKGSGAVSNLVADQKGALYGTTYKGGTDAKEALMVMGRYSG